MTENFKSTQFDELFNVNSIKVPFEGGTFKEINDNVSTAISSNADLKTVIRGLDCAMLADDKDRMRTDLGIYPTYLYDDSILNDTNYVLNKTVFLQDTLGVVRYTLDGESTTTFDDYSNWMNGACFGKDEIVKQYVRPEKTLKMKISDYDISMLNANIQQNIIDLAVENPDVDFYLFYTPYSIYCWDMWNQQGGVARQIQLEKEATKMMIEVDNIYLFGFNDEFDMICDANNYKDYLHYSDKINEQILVWMRNKEHQLTKENYEEYYNTIFGFYSTYDYESLF